MHSLRLVHLAPLALQATQRMQASSPTPRISPDVRPDGQCPRCGAIAHNRDNYDVIGTEFYNAASVYVKRMFCAEGIASMVLSHIPKSDECKDSFANCHVLYIHPDVHRRCAKCRATMINQVWRWPFSW